MYAGRAILIAKGAPNLAIPADARLAQVPPSRRIQERGEHFQPCPGGWGDTLMSERFALDYTSGVRPESIPCETWTDVDPIRVGKLAVRNLRVGASVDRYTTLIELASLVEPRLSDEMQLRIERIRQEVHQGQGQPVSGSSQGST